MYTSREDSTVAVKTVYGIMGNTSEEVLVNYICKLRESLMERFDTLGLQDSLEVLHKFRAIKKIRYAKAEKNKYLGDAYLWENV
ncbi:gp183 [Brochothrix phage A9]|uniref:Gp183 n=1 Tax=Brochothrix phage A9 TaxID=857312 RepID=D9J0Y1_9CAUD|nr:gp183 [Brochothrix phage A9]ADJ53218.1 gp183 [Brochothrix phage A9]